MALLIRDSYSALYKRLRRLYCLSTPPNLQALRNLSDLLLPDDVPETVEITTNSYEGGSATGSIVFQKALTLLVIEDLLEQYDPNLACFRPGVTQVSPLWKPISP